MSNFVHLHNHSINSLLDGAGKIEDYVTKSKELGFSHLGLTDHGNVDGIIKFQTECNKQGIVPISGIEFYCVTDIADKQKGEKRGHITVLARNETGWQNILKMITISNIDGFYYRPRISPEVLLAHSEGLVIMSACSSSFLNFGWGMELFKRIIDAKLPFYLEIMPHRFKEQCDINQKCLELSKEYNVPLVATNDNHYVNKEDAESQEVLLAVQTNKKWTDKDRWKFQDSGSYYLKSRAEMINGFRDQGILDRSVYMDAINRTMEVAELCSGFTILPKKKISLPKSPACGVKAPIDALQDLCIIGMLGKDIPSEDGEKYHERLRMELALIQEKNFEMYFLIVYELVQWCKQNDILVGPGRGSGSGSLVCYLLDITQVDPIKHHLVFERFINIKRKSLPDIDIDFEDIKRPLIKAHLEDLYGKWNIAGVSTFSYMRGKGALRDVSRVFSVPLMDVNKACEVIESKLKGDEGYEETIREAFSNYEEGKAFALKYPDVARIAMNIEGVARNRGVHASAVVVSDVDLRDGTRCAFVLGKDKEPIINWDKDDMEHQGLMKLDVLGLNTLTVLNSTKKLIKQNKNIDIDFTSIPLDDKRCYSEFSKGNAIGCFQLGSPGLRKFCQQLGIDNFQLLIDATSLYRPGTLRSGQAQIYTDRKHGSERVVYRHPIIENITKHTQGIIIYQEQMMRLVHELAGIDLETVDEIRKIIAKSKGREALMQYESQFVEGCIKNRTLSENEAVSLWNDLLAMGEYGFNLSHATTYSMITYWCMYCKIYHPTEYMCSLLSFGSNDKDKRNEYIDEIYRLGLEIRPPKIGKSKAYEWVAERGVLYAPFIMIKGVGDKTAIKFESVGKKKTGFYEKEEGDDKALTTRFMNILEKIDAYNDHKLTDEEADKITEYIDINLVRNKLHRYKSLVALLKSKLEIKDANTLNLHAIDPEYRYYIGEITDLDLTVSKGKEKRVLVSANFRDNSGYFKFSFSDTLYQSNKQKIEQCEGSFVLLLVNVPKKAGYPVAYQMWFFDDIVKGDFKGIDLCLAHGSRFQNRALTLCSDCELRNECHSPVLPSLGKYNMMIIGEYSNDQDERNGLILSGDVSQPLWFEIERYGYSRKDFNVTSVIKCTPKDPKALDKLHVKACRKWLEEEILNIKPFIVLAIGNTSIRYFTGEDSGIMAKSGKVEWSEKYGCFIVWCIHPSLTLYSSENKTLFKESIKIFINNVKNLGFLPF